jgi:hypothetical protein
MVSIGVILCDWKSSALSDSHSSCTSRQPDPIDWDIKYQVFSPDVAGGIRKRLTALFRFTAATYFPEVTFEFDEYIFEHYDTWPQGEKLASYDCVFVTGASGLIKRQYLSAKS